MKDPLVSVIIINYNTFELTSQTIASVIQQTSGISYEIVLVDNASTECDADLFLKTFSSVQLIKNKTNKGFAKGNNTGIAKSKGEYILLLNSDTELKNNCLQIGIDTLKNNAQLAVVSVKLMYPDGKIQPQCIRFPSVKLLLLEKFRLHKLFSPAKRGKLLLSTYFDHQTYTEPDAVWGTFFMFPKSVLERLPEKKLNDDYFMYYEDIQWCLDFKKLGMKIAYEPAGEVIHYHGKSKGDKTELMKKNKMTFLKKNYSSIKIFLLRLLHY
jgi:GT2 family glycosyltransferase